MKQSFRMSYLRQLCTLDVSEAALIPAVLQEFSAIFDLDMCCFNWLSHDGSISHAHLAGLLPPIDIVERYATEYVNQDETELGITTRQRLHRPQILSGSRDLGQRFLGTIAYNKFVRPIGLRYMLSASIFSDTGVTATVSCMRMGDQREFSRADDQLLNQMLPYLTLASVARISLNDEQWSEESERGILLIDTHGSIRHADALALNRLYRATRNTRTAGTRSRIDTAMRAPLRLLAQRLRRIEAGIRTQPPELRLQTEGRRFGITARALRSSPTEPLDLIAVSISEWVPGILQVLPWLREHGLSTRQRELALHLHGGVTLADAARLMDVRLSTAQDYLSVIYTKLGVKSRDALLLRLHTLPRSSQPITATA